MKTVGLRIDPRRDEPIYRQIFDQVVARIEARTFPAGYKLPPARVLAKDLATHRNTVARAYADLEAAGFVSSSVGRGTFVEARASVGATGGVAREVTTAIPWSSLLSSGARSETLRRAELFARRTEGRDIVNLARQQPSPDLLPDALIGRCMERALAEHGARALILAPPEGIPRLREQIADDLSARGVPADPADILVTSGSQQALDLVARALVNPGDIVLVEGTTYLGAIELFTLAGARLVPVHGDDQGPDPAALHRLARPDVKALYLMPNGHNPTGLTIATERRHELVAWSHATGIPLIEDDFGAGLLLDHREAPPYLRALDGEVVHMSTFSKTLVPALRLGFVLCPPALRAVLCSMKRVVDLGASAILQHALADFMERGYLRAHRNRIVPEYRARRDALEHALQRALPPEVAWHRPSHGVVLWLRLPPALDPDEVHEEAFRQGVLVGPSALFSAFAGAERGIRLAFCAEPPSRLAEGAKRLGKAMKVLLARKPRAKRDEPPTVEVV